MTDTGTDLGLYGVPLAIFAGSIRVGTPFLFVSLGECVTEKAGRVNLGLEGTLVMGAMTGFAVSYLASAPWIGPGAADPDGATAQAVRMAAPWLGVLAAGAVGTLLGVVHAVICNRPRVNYVAVGIAMMIFGLGLASFLGTPFIKPRAPKLPDIPFDYLLNFLAPSEPVRAALRINALFLVGVVLAPLLAWGFRNTRWGLMLRLAGESEEAAAAMGYSVGSIRIVATAVGGFLAGIGGSFLSLYYPGNWTEPMSSGQGLMAVALVIFARWKPVNCLWASLLFGGVGSVGLALQGANLTSASAAYLWNTAPYVLTLGIMILTCSRARAMIGAPAELVRVRG
jgi:general nucleoside transport system permease protein